MVLCPQAGQAHAGQAQQHVSVVLVSTAQRLPHHLQRARSFQRALGRRRIASIQLAAQLCLHGILLRDSRGQAVLLSNVQAEQTPLGHQPDLLDGPFLREVGRHRQQPGGNRFLELRPLSQVPRLQHLCKVQCRLCQTRTSILPDSRLERRPLGVRQGMPHRVGQLGHRLRCRHGL